MASELVGNWSWTVWLLIPLALMLAVLTALALGSRTEPPPTRTQGRGVGRHLARAAEESATR